MPRFWCAFLLPLCLAAAARGDEIDKKYPLDEQLKVLADDITNDVYRKLVVEKMLPTDLAAEWQRVATADNADSFLEKHGGKDKVLADADLKRAYERRVQIRDDFLELMRQGYKRYKMKAPFDAGAKAEPAGTTTRAVKGAALALAPVPPVLGAEAHWPRLRGPTGQGETSRTKLPVTWNKSGENIVWRVKVPGQGNSSPIVWGDRIFLTSAEDKGAKRLLHCLHAADGRTLWTRQAPEKKPESIGFKNTFASATPVTDGERVVAAFGSSGLVCYDFEGKQLWHHPLDVRTTHGPGSSPVLYGDLVIVAQDQNQAPSIFKAVDKRTGQTIWEGKRDKAMTWTTPTVVRVGDHDELIVAGGETVRGYDPKTGRELWKLKGPTQEVVPAIVVGPDMVYCASGRNGPTLGLRPGGSGDVTETHLVWRTVRGGPHVPSPALANGRLYTANDTGIVTCLDAATGKLIFQERLRDTFASSPLVANGLVYAGGESGVTYVFKASDKFELVAKNDLGALLQASPAVVGDRLLIRAGDELVCVGAKGENWPQWRGPRGDGVSAATGLPLTWDDTANVLWKRPLADGASTPAVWGDAVFVTAHDGSDLNVLRLDRATGNVVWQRTVGRGEARRQAPARKEQKFHKLHNLASPSPVTDGSRVWVHFGTGDLAAYDFAGNLLWKRNLQEDYGPYSIWWGHANSPVLFKDLLISVCMQDSNVDLGAKPPKESYLVAHDAATGAVRWKTPRPTDAKAEECDSYITPIFAEVERKTQMIVMGGRVLDAYDPATGTRLWHLAGLDSNRCITGATLADGVVFAVGGMKRDLFAVKAGGSGARPLSDILWKTRDSTPDSPTPVVVGGLLFVVANNGVAQCLDAKTGAVKWKERLAGEFSASPLAAEGRVYFVNQAGRSTVVRAAATFEKLADNRLADEIVASPAAVDGTLFLRGRKALYCLGGR